MTEDMLEEHAEYLSSLEEGEDRIRAQIGTLLSDMQAFKVWDSSLAHTWVYRQRIRVAVWKISCAGTLHGIGFQTKTGPEGGYLKG